MSFIEKFIYKNLYRKSFIDNGLQLHIRTIDQDVARVYFFDVNTGTQCTIPADYSFKLEVPSYTESFMITWVQPIPR